jgi:hypothetical protein
VRRPALEECRSSTVRSAVPAPGVARLEQQPIPDRAESDGHAADAGGDHRHTSHEGLVHDERRVLSQMDGTTSTSSASYTTSA